MRLSELKTGESATIVKVMGHGGFRRRIMEMGFVRGQRVEVILNAPLKDPIEYKIMGYDISLRRSEADMVVVLTDDEAGEYLARREHHRHHRHAHSGECGCPAAETAPAEIRTEEFGATESDEACCASIDEVVARHSRTIAVALVGNPNSGKTSLFNAISGGHEHVGNYSGVTVGAKIGHRTYRGYSFEVTDLPGTYALSAYTPEGLAWQRQSLAYMDGNRRIVEDFFRTRLAPNKIYPMEGAFVGFIEWRGLKLKGEELHSFLEKEAMAVLEPGDHYAPEYAGYSRINLGSTHEQTRALLEGREPAISAAGKDVVVIGGGDTGNDCMGTAVRQGARTVRQLEYGPCAPEQRAASNAWPEWPNVKKTDYGQEEAIALQGDDLREWCADTQRVLLDGDGRVRGLQVHSLDWSAGKPSAVEGSEREIDAQLVLVACGFAGPEHGVFDALGVPVATTGRPLPVMEGGATGAAAATHRAELAEGAAAAGRATVYVAGDARNGSSLVVSSMADALKCAAEVAVDLGL